VRLEQRLRLLQGESTQLPLAPATAAGDFTERLRRLVPKAGGRTEGKAPDEHALADALGAERLAPGVLRVRRHIEPDSRHGRTRLGDCLSALPDLLDGPAGHPNGWLFLDTESSGLGSGTGTWAFLCGLLRFESQSPSLCQYLLTRLDAESPYLEAIASELDTACLLVTYNGKSFDGPLLATRLRLAGLATTLDHKPHLDLLHPVRRAFGRVWPDCRLTTAEKRLLGFAREGDLPGAEAPAAWLAWLRRGEVPGLAAVLRHNRWDLLSLPALARPLSQSLFEPAATGADIQSVARLHLSRGDADLALALLLANRDRLMPSALLDLARLQRRRGDWAAAGAIWESLAEKGHPEAIEAQAKYLEHRARDYIHALEWVERLPPSPDRERRRRRLHDKVQACALPLWPHQS
jgi:uncharacterized protein YprB with RNaseH-like and TPR domain